MVLQNPGPSPLSEGENKAVLELLNEFKPHAVFSIHTGGRGVLTPGEFRGDGKYIPQTSKMNKQVANWMMNNGLCTECRMGASFSALYETLGGMSDYMTLLNPLHKVPVFFTLETYGPSIPLNIYAAPELAAREEEGNNDDDDNEEVQTLRKLYSSTVNLDMQESDINELPMPVCLKTFNPVTEEGAAQYDREWVKLYDLWTHMHPDDTEYFIDLLSEHGAF
jgi:hypothetical protein